MTRISKRQLDKDKFQEMNENFAFLISSLTKATEIEDFFNEFLTKEEKIMLTKRLVLYMMIKQGFSANAIQSILHVSYETVRTYQNQFHYRNQSFQKIIEKLLKRERVINFFKRVEEILKPLDLALKSKTNMKARSKFASGNYT